MSDEYGRNERIEVEMPEALSRALEVEAAKTPGGMDALAEKIWTDGAALLNPKSE